MRRGQCTPVITGVIAALILGLNTSSGATEVKLKGGIHVADDTGKFRFAAGGRIQNDWAYLHPGGLMRTSAEVKSGTEFRRIRIYMKGLFYGFAGFKAQYDFAGGKVHVKDMYVTFQHVPVLGAVLIGHQKTVNAFVIHYFYNAGSQLCGAGCAAGAGHDFTNDGFVDIDVFIQ